MLPLNSWTLIIHFHSGQNIIPHHDHLHMHQTGIISIVIMRPLPHIRSKEHLGVIRCKALQGRKKCLIWGDIKKYYTWLHISVALSPPFLIAFCIRLHFSDASQPFPRYSSLVEEEQCVSLRMLIQPASSDPPVSEWDKEREKMVPASSTKNNHVISEGWERLSATQNLLNAHLCCLLITLCS